jgi:RNA recognition motif-containing protein
VSVTREDGENMSDRRGARYPDSHQLFVGNLPHNVAEQELRKFFESTIKIPLKNSVTQTWKYHRINKKIKIVIEIWWNFQICQ